ncbi:MAG: DUF1934 domain-containing protein [Lachnospiraceae bacterium]|nr:DUF1934 domain-containing protein [Lachnospiraceae bacterium]
MEKDVWVSVAGLQFGNSPEGERIEILTPGCYYRKKDHHYLTYDEVVEGSDEITRNIVKFDDDMLSISKSGFANVEMIFEKNKRNMTNYVTPYGSLVVGIDTDRIDIVEKEDQINIDIDYALDVNYEHLANCRIKMEITSSVDMDSMIK